MVMTIVRSTYYDYYGDRVSVTVVGFVRDESNKQTLAICINEDGKWIDVPLDKLQGMEKS